MGKAQIEEIYSAKYRCRNCGGEEIYKIMKGIYGYKKHKLSNYNRWYMTSNELEKDIDRVRDITERILGREYKDDDRIPDQFIIHYCEDGTLGLSEFIGYVDVRYRKKKGRGYILVTEDGKPLNDNDIP